MEIPTPEEIKNRNTFLKIAACLLLVAVLPVWPYVFYQLLKVFIFGTAVYAAYLYHKQKVKQWMWYMIVAAILFNPINPFYFGSFLWSIVDLIVACMFLTSCKKE